MKILDTPQSGSTNFSIMEEMGVLGGGTRPARGRFCGGCGRVFSQKDAGKDQLPWAEGWGEGELDRRTVAAGQNVFGTRETEPQNLAALDKNVRAPITRANNQRVSKGHEDKGLL